MGARRRSCPQWLIFALAATLTGGCGAGGGQVVIFTQEPVRLESGGARADGCRIVSLSASGEIRVLSRGFAAAADPCLSFDGGRILFAGQRRRGDDWNIWEMDADGGGKRQLTRALGKVAEPFYLPRASITPPEFTDRAKWIGFTSELAGAHEARPGRRATALYVATREPVEGRGQVTWRTTFSLQSDFSPTLLSDGRVLFSSHRFGRTPLMTVNWAGTGLNVFYEDHATAVVRSEATELPDRSVVFVESDGAGNAGHLARVSLRRPLKSYERLSVGEGRFRTPGVTASGRLVAAAPGDSGSYGLYYFDFDSGQAGELLYDDPDWDDVDPQFPRPGPEPPTRIPITTEGGDDTGLLYCLNVYDSDRAAATRIEPGQVDRVRFVEGVPGGDGNGPYGRARILGEAPVEEDGSFFVEVPADTPLLIQTLNKEGDVLQSMSGWMWVRAGSRRGCIGCHEDRELTPVNRLVSAIRKGTPHQLLAPAADRPPVDLPWRHLVAAATDGSGEEER